VREIDRGLASKTIYNIIEISSKLAEKQMSVANDELKYFNGNNGKINIFNTSILEWTEKIDSECYVIGMEVIVSSILKFLFFFFFVLL